MSAVAGYRGAVAAAAVAAMLGAGAAMAADQTADDEAESLFDVYFGMAVTSDYLSRGITQSDHAAAIQGYVEAIYGMFYIGGWASSVSFGGDKDIEFDFYFGVRPEVGDVAFDLGYTHYHYLNDPSFHFGEFYAFADAPVHDDAAVGAKVYFAPDYALSGTTATYVEANADLTLPHDLGLSGAVGYQVFDPAYGSSYLTWNLGLYYALNDVATLDLRYSDTNLSPAACGAIAVATTDCDARVLLTLSIDSAISSLGGGGDDE
jgi:uncharacterized protein (TIGR02001 family)